MTRYFCDRCGSEFDIYKMLVAESYERIIRCHSTVVPDVPLKTHELCLKCHEAFKAWMGMGKKK